MCAVCVSPDSPTSICSSVIISKSIVVSLRLLISAPLKCVLCSLIIALQSHANNCYINALVDPTAVARMEALQVHLSCPVCHAEYATLEALREHMDSHDFGSSHFIYPSHFITIICCKDLISSALQTFSMNCLNECNQAPIH